MPVFLASVPLHLPLDTPLPKQMRLAIPMQEAIEQRAASFGVATDARVERGRDFRHALRETLRHERFDRLVVAVGANGDGFGAGDVAWLLGHAPGEIIALRPARGEPRVLPPFDA